MRPSETTDGNLVPMQYVISGTFVASMRPSETTDGNSAWACRCSPSCHPGRFNEAVGNYRRKRAQPVGGRVAEVEASMRPSETTDGNPVVPGLPTPGQVPLQ